MWSEYDLVYKQALIPADIPRASGQPLTSRKAAEWSNFDKNCGVQGWLQHGWHLRAWLAVKKSERNAGITDKRKSEIHQFLVTDMFDKVSMSKKILWKISLQFSTNDEILFRCPWGWWSKEFVDLPTEAELFRGEAMYWSISFNRVTTKNQNIETQMF